MQQHRQQQDADPDGEEGINPSLYAEMVKGFISKYEFEGEAAELVGQVGMQPELGVKCRCCGEAECTKTLICDACENSFHLKCSKLRLSHALLLDHWLCMDCSLPLHERPLRPLCEHTLAIGDELCKRNSPSKRRRHSHAPIAPQPLPQVEDGASKIRFVFKLKNSHFKGARALANEEAQIVGDRLTDESVKEVLVDSAKRPSHQMECLSLVQQQEVTNPSILSSQEASKELVVAGIQTKKVKLADILVVSEKHKKDIDSPKLPSCQMQSLSFHHHHNGAGLHQFENVSEELREAFGIHEKKADNLASGKHTDNSLESVTHHSCLEFDDEYHKHNGDVCRSGTLSEMAKEEKVVEVQENKREINNKTAGKIDMSEKATLNNADCAMTTFVDADAHSKQRGDAIDYWMTSSRSGYAGTNEKIDKEAEENKEAEEIRSLVRVLDDAQKHHWHKDAIELMDLEASRCSKDNDVDEGQASPLSKPHLQVHGKLDTARLLQVYADCRERCIIVYHMGRGMEHRVENSQQTNFKVSDTAIERTWSLGGGFYVLLLGSKEAAKQVIFNGTIPFRGGTSYAVPYVPCFSPNQEPERACPVWVTFLHLPIYFRPFLQELASWLGKVLHVPYGEALEVSDSPRVCICWKISKCIPEFLVVDIEGLGRKKLRIEFDLSLLRHLSESFPQKMACTRMVPSLRKEVVLENSLFKERSDTDECLQRRQD